MTASEGRAAGWYWVRHEGRNNGPPPMEIAWFDGGVWWTPRIGHAWVDSDFAEIDERPITRAAAAPAEVAEAVKWLEGVRGHHAVMASKPSILGQEHHEQAAAFCNTILRALRASGPAAGQWWDISSAPDGPILAGYRTQFGEWYWQRFEGKAQPIALGYTHFMVPTPPALPATEEPK